MVTFYIWYVLVVIVGFVLNLLQQISPDTLWITSIIATGVYVAIMAIQSETKKKG